TKIALVAGLFVALFATVVALHLQSQKELVPVDQDTLCPTDRPPAEVLVFLLDMSDAFSEPQRLKIRNEIDRLKDSITRFGLIEAYAVDSLDNRVTKPVLHLCNPGTGVDLSRIYQNPDLARRKWDGFARKLDLE